jgi:uncharacterized protein
VSRSSSVGSSQPQARIRRSPKKARYDRDSIRRVLDRARVAHVAFIDRGHPYCIPMLYGRVGDRLYIHGARTSRLIRLLAAGTPACVTVTVLDALILARSAFEHSANYDSAALHGAFELVTGTKERLAALEAFTEAVVPGRWREVRAPNGKELRATAILAMPIDQAAVKTRTGPPDDDDSPDADLEVWAGVIPVTNLYGPAQPSPGLRAGVRLSDSVRRLVEGGR